MPLYFQRPENALKRANEFIDIGEKQWALDALYDVIKSRKHRTWQKIHEPIMCKYLELCIDLKKSHIAKEGLYQYRNICQQVNIKSLEELVRFYLKLSEEKTKSAREESQQVVDIDDLDQVQTPENLLLSAVSSEDIQDRTDRVVLLPWVKFLWESYRQCLELLRNNSNVERLYHDVAQQAFKFCVTYNRKTEFRKLSDVLRLHLGHIYKNQNLKTAVNLDNPESQAMHLETRLVRLDCAILMELWQEAYKAIEDVYNLMSLSKKAPSPRLMYNYYQKLSLVFWKSNNYLFHAATLFRLFNLSREQKKNITTDEITRSASRVILATLAVPEPPKHTEVDRLVETEENLIDKNHRILSTLLGLPYLPNRTLLIKDLIRFGIIQCAPTQLKELYHWLEIEFQPLNLCSRVKQLFDYLYMWKEVPEFCQYIPPIQKHTAVRLISEISQVYETISFSRLLHLAPFMNSFDLEYLTVEIGRRNGLQVRIDHTEECFHFGSELNIFQTEVVEGPRLQNTPNKQLREHLVVTYNMLMKALHFIQPDEIRNKKTLLKNNMARAYHLTFNKDRIQILSRQQYIEQRKEMLEILNYKREIEEKKIIEDQKHKLWKAEQERIARETEERTKQRILKEQSEIKRKVVMEKIEKLRKMEIGSKLFEGMDEEELEKLNPDDILNKQVEQLDREKREFQMKLRAQERRINHLERAKRLEEIPLLQAEYEEYKMKHFEQWERREKKRIKSIYDERVLAIKERDRLKKMKEDIEEFFEDLKKARFHDYQEKATEFENLLDKKRKEYLAERKEKRRKERRLAWLKEQEENRLRLAEEQLKRELEEELVKLEEIRAKQKEEKKFKDNEVVKTKYQDYRKRNEPRKIDMSEELETREKPQVQEYNWRGLKDVETKQENWKSDAPNEEKMWRRDDGPKDEEKMWRRDDRPKDDERVWRRVDRSRDERPKEEERMWRKDDRAKQEERMWKRDDRPKEEERMWRRDVRPKEEEGMWRKDVRPKEEERMWRRDDRPNEEERMWRRHDRPKEEERMWRTDDRPRDKERAWRRDARPVEEERFMRKNDERKYEERSWRRHDDVIVEGRNERCDNGERIRKRDDELRNEERNWRRDNKPKSDERVWRRDDKLKYDRSWRQGEKWQSNQPSLDRYSTYRIEKEHEKYQRWTPQGRDKADSEKSNDKPLADWRRRDESRK